MTFDTIVVEREGPIMWLTLNRPNEANAISTALAQEFCAAVEEADADPGCHVLVLQGAGRHFCAGGDVAMMVAAPDPADFLGNLARTMHAGLLRLAASSLVTVAVVHGPAAGAGLGLVLNADIVLAGPGAKFLTAYGAVGLSPDCGVSHLLPRVVGPRRASAMALLGRAVSAEEAVDWGLANEVVPDGQLVERARELGTALGTGAPQMLGSTKRLLAGAQAAGYAAHLDEEADNIAALIAHPQTLATLEAFVSKRRG